MRKIIYATMALLSPLLFYAQNLVPNYSFEQHDTCPYNTEQIRFAVPWFQPHPPTGGYGADYFNQCSTTGEGVPLNWNGYQYARTGVAYADIAVYSGNFSNYREYLEAPLKSPLLSGQRYCVQFYVSRTGWYDSPRAVDAIGAYLSTDLVWFDNPNYDKILPYLPQVENARGNIIQDTINWVLISGEFIAQGGEKFITIGNFYPDSSTIVDTLGDGYAGYFIDDVSVTLCEIEDNTTSQIAAPNAFSPNGDGQNDVFRANGKNILSFEMSIYNRWGEKVFESNDINTGWDGTYRGNSAQVGVYIYVINATGNDGKKYDLKGNLSLLR